MLFVYRLRAANRVWRDPKTSWLLNLIGWILQVASMVYVYIKMQGLRTFQEIDLECIGTHSNIGVRRCSPSIVYA